MNIPFNKPFIAGKELYYIAEAVTRGNVAADGYFTKACSRLLEERFGIKKVLLVPSGTAALELAAMLCNLQPGDEVILPSYTFVSTASAFVRVGARPVFVDIRPDTLNLDERLVERAITPRTRAIVPVHYAGVACEMDTILDIARRHKLLVIEDAAQGVNAFYKGRALGSIGHLGCYSFHETKNYICGEGGALCINDEQFIERAEILRDKGTNRQKFFRGEVDKYTWVDLGSSYVLSEILAAFLYGQLEHLDAISARRREIYERYDELLAPLEDQGFLRRPRIPPECHSNFHLYCILLSDEATRDALMAHLKAHGTLGVFHYLPLHTSPMGKTLGYGEGQLPVTESLWARLLRLPMFYQLSAEQQENVAAQIASFFGLPSPRPVGAKSCAPCVRSLSWDSAHFGFPVGAITAAEISDDDELACILASARAARYALLYWRSSRQRAVPGTLLQKYGGVLVDTAVTFVKPLDEPQADFRGAAPNDSQPPTAVEIRPVEQGEREDLLDELAIAAGQFSRFFCDPKIPAEKARELYRIWARKSAAGQLADRVFAAWIGDRSAVPVGFVTVTLESNAARVGLIAVAVSHQNQGVGAALMRCAEDFARQRRVRQMLVTTQLRNHAACRLYERTGYVPVKLEHVYHFWLRDSAGA